MTLAEITVEDALVVLIVVAAVAIVLSVFPWRR